MSPKKSPAQLDREISEALRRKKKTSSTTRVSRGGAVSGGRGGCHSSRNAHATAKFEADPKQEERLMVANDAALSDQYARAAKLLGQSGQRKIATAFTTVTEESSAAGDYASRGWEDKDGDDIEIDDYDIEKEADAGSHAPVTDAIVDKAVQWLKDHGASSTSSTRFQPGTWYETEFEMDYGSGEEKQEEFFLRHFTTQEEKLIFDRFNKDR